jgi:hypothetical protein
MVFRICQLNSKFSTTRKRDTGCQEAVIWANKHTFAASNTDRNGATRTANAGINNCEHYPFWHICNCSRKCKRTSTHIKR